MDISTSSYKYDEGQFNLIFKKLDDMQERNCRLFQHTKNLELIWGKLNALYETTKLNAAAKIPSIEHEIRTVEVSTESLRNIGISSGTTVAGQEHIGHYRNAVSFDNGLISSQKELQPKFSIRSYQEVAIQTDTVTPAKCHNCFNVMPPYEGGNGSGLNLKDQLLDQTIAGDTSVQNSRYNVNDPVPEGNIYHQRSGPQLPQQQLMCSNTAYLHEGDGELMTRSFAQELALPISGQEKREETIPSRNMTYLPQQVSNLSNQDRARVNQSQTLNNVVHGTVMRGIHSPTCPSYQVVSMEGNNYETAGKAGDQLKPDNMFAGSNEKRAYLQEHLTIETVSPRIAQSIIDSSEGQVEPQSRATYTSSRSSPDLKKINTESTIPKPSASSNNSLPSPGAVSTLNGNEMQVVSHQQDALNKNIDDKSALEKHPDNQSSSVPSNKENFITKEMPMHHAESIDSLKNDQSSQSSVKASDQEENQADDESNSDSFFDKDVGVPENAYWSMLKQVQGSRNADFNSESSDDIEVAAAPSREQKETVIRQAATSRNLSTPPSQPKETVKETKRPSPSKTTVEGAEKPNTLKDSSVSAHRSKKDISKVLGLIPDSDTDVDLSHGNKVSRGKSDSDDFEFYE